MEKITFFNDYMKKVFHTKGWWYILPFTLLGLIFALVYYIYVVPFMLLDYPYRQLKGLLYKDNDKIDGRAQAVKFAIGYFFFMIFALIAIIAGLPLMLAYFLTFCCFFVSSIGKVRGNPFALNFLD